MRCITLNNIIKAMQMHILTNAISFFVSEQSPFWLHVPCMSMLLSLKWQTCIAKWKEDKKKYVMEYIHKTNDCSQKYFAIERYQKHVINRKRNSKRKLVTISILTTSNKIKKIRPSWDMSRYNDLECIFMFTGFIYKLFFGKEWCEVKGHTLHDCDHITVIFNSLREIM